MAEILHWPKDDKEKEEQERLAREQAKQLEAQELLSAMSDTAEVREKERVARNFIPYQEKPSEIVPNFGPTLETNKPPIHSVETLNESLQADLEHVLTGKKEKDNNEIVNMIEAAMEDGHEEKAA